MADPILQTNRSAPAAAAAPAEHRIDQGATLPSMPLNIKDDDILTSPAKLAVFQNRMLALPDNTPSKERNDIEDRLVRSSVARELGLPADATENDIFKARGLPPKMTAS